MDMRIQLAITVLLSAELMACTHGKTNEDNDMALAHTRAALSTTSEIRPFHVATFDHVPTEEEVDREFRGFMESRADIDPIDDIGIEDDPTALLPPIGNVPPLPGQKQIRLDAITSNIDDAGTDANNAIRFTGQWRTGNGAQFSETFILNNPDVDDLDRGTVSIFYYLINLQQHAPGATQDRFIRGKIANVSEDGWHCSQVRVREKNHRGTVRLQSLPFNQWVDSPSQPESGWMAGNNAAWLSYN